MFIKRLLKNIKHYSNITNNHRVKNVTSYLSEVIDGSLYISLNTDDIKNAITKGAKTIVLDKKVKVKEGINFIYVDNILKTRAILYKRFYNKRIKIIGIIGTNGKGSVGDLIYNYLKKYYKCFFISTNKIYYNDKIIKTNNTTLDITKIYKNIAYAYDNDYKYLIMEVSSIGISELRVFDIEFYRLIFTNFSSEHLEYHSSIDDYFYTKMIPFYKNKCLKIINKDDLMFNKIIKYIDESYYTYSINKECDFYISDYFYDDLKLCIRINGEVYKSNLYADYNVYNLLAFFTFLKSINKFNNVGEFLENYNGLDGRMSVRKYKNNYIFVDYAHNAGALLAVLTYLNKIKRNKVVCVGGCGGNKYLNKRIEIGNILNKYSDYTILCDDNPKDEDSLKIINEIKQDYDFDIVVKRSEAIKKGISLLNEYDILLIFGKGDEDYVIKGSEKILHNDLLYVWECIK